MFQTRNINIGKIAGQVLLAVCIMAAPLAWIPWIHSAGAAVTVVTFGENDTAADGTYDTQGGTGVTPLTLFADLTTKFVNSGYHFVDWNTSADGTGTTYLDGAEYDFTLGNLTLYAQWAPNTVTFNENDNGSDTTHSIESNSVSAPLTLFSSLDPAFSNSGYSFAGWSTAANGTGASYANGATYDFTLGNLILYAQWTANTYTVTYDAEGGTLAATSETYTTGSAPLTLPSPTQQGLTFSGWYSAPTGGTLIGRAGASFAPTASLTLYAQWAANAYTVTYDADGGTLPVASGIYTTGSAPLTLPSPTQQGFSFDGWYSAPTGGTFVGLAGTAYTPTTSSTLYAQWTADTYVVTYDAEGGTLVASSGIYTTGSAPLTLPRPTQQGFSFNGWYSAPTGGTLIGLAGASFAPTVASTLYAQWTVLPVWQMSFASNGAVGEVPTLSVQQDSLLTVPAGSDLRRPGYSFTGWNTMADGSGTGYAAGQSVALTAPVELYAQWKPLPAVSVQFHLGATPSRIPPVSTFVGAAITLPSPPARSHPGYLFAGWSTSASGSGTRWRSGSHLEVTSSMTFYAQWRSNHSAVMLPAIGPFARTSARLPREVTSQVRRIAVTVVATAHRTVVLYGLARRRTTVAAATRLAQMRALAVSRILCADLRRLGDGAVRLVLARQVVGGARTDVVEVVAR